MLEIRTHKTELTKKSECTQQYHMAKQAMYIGIKQMSTNIMLAILVSNVEVYSLFSVKDCHEYGKLWQIKEYIFPITKELFPLKDIPDYVDLYITIRNLVTYFAYDLAMVLQPT
jgi:hypothetical protein